jgi:hypothetical protein
MAWFLLICCLGWQAWGQAPAVPATPPVPPPGGDAKELIRRALNVDQKAFRRARDYTFERREEMKVLDKKGAVKKREVDTYDVTILYDEPYSRRIRKDDKPLSEADEKKEAAKLDKLIADRRNEGADARQKRLDKLEKEREQARAFVRDIINAYDFHFLGDERVDGHETYVVDAIPRRDFHPTQPHADVLPKVRGKLWLNQSDYGCVKVEAQTLDTISWGLFFVRIHKGSMFRLEQMRVNDEVWLPRRMSLDASARVAMFISANVGWEATFSQYKKFTSGSRILPGAAAVDPQAATPQ